MAHRLSLEAEAELDAIWLYTAGEGGNVEAADRLIENLTKRFFFLAAHPYLGRHRDDHLAPGFEALLWASTSSFSAFSTLRC